MRRKTQRRPRATRRRHRHPRHIRQQGGFLEPLQRTPPFHYTTAASRIAWTRTVYPYAPYFFQLFKSIPWSEWYYEDDEITVRCNEVPYVIIGGAAHELYDREFGRALPAKHRLHTAVDPTGDIDCRLSGLVLIRKDGKPSSKEDLYYMKDGKVQPFMDHFTRWLLYRVTVFFSALAYNFETWYPETLPFDASADPEAAAADIGYMVGPFAIYRAVFEDALKIQVSMAVPFEGPDGALGRKIDHMIEFIGWNGAEAYDQAEDATFLPGVGLWVSDIDREMLGNQVAIEDRVVLKGDPTYSHKFWNHIYRSIYLLHLAPHVPPPSKFESPEKYRRIVCRSYADILETLTSTKEDDVATKLLDAVDPAFCPS